MSIDIHAAFAEADWPTVAQVEKCFAAEKIPVRLIGLPDGSLTIDPVGIIRVSFREETVIFEAEVNRVDADNTYTYTYEEEPEIDRTDENGIRFTMSSVSDEPIPVSINSDLEKIGAYGKKFGEGDYVLTVSFSHYGDRNQPAAAMLTIGGLIKCFNGYGFEFQTNSHGSKDFGQDLIQQALKEDEK